MATRRRRLLLALPAATVVAATSAFFVLRDSGRGTLRGFDGDVGVGLPLDHVGQSRALSGPWVVRNSGGKPITLEGVVPIRPQSGIVLRKAVVRYRIDALGFGKPGSRPHGHPLRGR
jgi:hypothetical protein